MLGGLVVAFVITAVASAVYAVIQASLKWAHDLERSMSRGRRGGGRRFTGRCAACGLSFLEHPGVEDGKCLDCGRTICRGCKAGLWLCPFCNKKREEEEVPKPGRGVKRTSFSSIVHSLLKHREHYGSTESLFKRLHVDNHRHSNGISFETSNIWNFTKDNPLMNRELVKPKDSESGYKSSNSGLSDYESDKDTEPVLESWEENWLFRKKHPIQPSVQPLAMFVPRPATDSKARIGGVEVDQISDFSDYTDSEIDDIIN